MSDPTQVPQAPGGWTVVSQQEGTELGPNGVFVKGVTVFFNTGSGTTGSVFVPDMMFHPENVRAAIEAKVALINGVSGLSG